MPGLVLADSADRCRRLDAVAFDLDGTITDSLECCLFALQSALSSVGLAPPSVDELRPTAGLPLMTSVPPMLVEARATHIDVRDVIRAYEDCYPALSRQHTLLMDGVEDVLASLHEQLPLAVVTSKATSTANDVLEHTGLDKYFSVVFGSDRASALKPDPAPLIEACNHLQVSPQLTAMVGDADVDMLMARAAGAYAVGVNWGSSSSAVLMASGAHSVTSSPSELLDFLVGKAIGQQVS